ncbi:hypothetical protein [Hyphomonas sp.]|uniref:hypothetical protein n=1 Tax=Hyphomonas sp. TaxID=87 RepID=UPI001BCD98B1|nr:hypothetical protein [Hyphomonas sp.]
MIPSSHIVASKAALIVLLSGLSACQTTSPAEQADTPAHMAAAPGEMTGEGWYYPPISSEETPDIRFGKMAGIGPEERQFFTDQVNLTASTPGRTFPIVAQAVGENRETLVFLYLDAEGPMTPYLARAILARLTSVMRSAPAIAEMGLSSEFDIYNTAAVLGFAQIIITDGRDFSHQAKLRES